MEKGWILVGYTTRTRSEQCGVEGALARRAWPGSTRMRGAMRARIGAASINYCLPGNNTTRPRVTVPHMPCLLSLTTPVNSPVQVGKEEHIANLRRLPRHLLIPIPPTILNHFILGTACSTARCPAGHKDEQTDRFRRPLASWRILVEFWSVGKRGGETWAGGLGISTWLPTTSTNSF